MASAFVQFRADENIKLRASSICEKLGMDLQTYLRMCISRLVQENGVPFAMNLNSLPEDPALTAMKAMSEIAAANGTSEMTLDEINAEIAAVRSKE